MTLCSDEVAFTQGALEAFLQSALAKAPKADKAAPVQDAPAKAAKADKPAKADKLADAAAEAPADAPLTLLDASDTSDAPAPRLRAPWRR